MKENLFLKRYKDVDDIKDELYRLYELCDLDENSVLDEHYNFDSHYLNDLDKIIGLLEIKTYDMINKKRQKKKNKSKKQFQIPTFLENIVNNKKIRKINENKKELNKKLFEKLITKLKKREKLNEGYNILICFPYELTFDFTDKEIRYLKLTDITRNLRHKEIKLSEEETERIKNIINENREKWHKQLFEKLITKLKKIEELTQGWNMVEYSIYELTFDLFNEVQNIKLTIMRTAEFHKIELSKEETERIKNIINERKK